MLSWRIERHPARSDAKDEHAVAFLCCFTRFYGGPRPGGSISRLRSATIQRRESHSVPCLGLSVTGRSSRSLTPEITVTRCGGFDGDQQLVGSMQTTMRLKLSCVLVNRDTRANRFARSIGHRDTKFEFGYAPCKLIHSASSALTA
jgi:hypothetical protein